MALARETFLASMEGVRSSLSDEALSTKALLPANAQHNQTSRILRRGLFVVTFNMLEDFLKSRMSELLELASATSLRFEDLPPGLRAAALGGAYKSGKTQATFQRGDADAILQDVAAAVASTAGGVALRLHRYAFLHSGSNIGAQDISEVLSALHVRGPWTQLDEIAALCGVSTLPLEGLYSSLHQKRNAAAHQVTATIEIADLRDLVQTAIVLAMAFDIACSCRILPIRENRVFVPGTAKSEVAPEVQVRHVTEHARGWAELRTDGRARKVHAIRHDAVASALTRAQRPETVLVTAADNSPVDWYPFGY